MISLGVAIMAHPKREALVTELQEMLDYPATVVWDRRGDRWDTGRRSLLAFSEEPGVTHWLVIQDDGLPARNLCASLPQVLKHAPANPVSLYCGRQRPHSTWVDRCWDQVRGRHNWMVLPHLLWGVALVFPVGMIRPMVGWVDRHGTHQNYDMRLDEFLTACGVRTWYTVPSLVDHRDGTSLVAGRSGEGRKARDWHRDDPASLPWDSAPPDLEIHRPTYGVVRTVSGRQEWRCDQCGWTTRFEGRISRHVDEHVEAARL